MRVNIKCDRTFEDLTTHLDLLQDKACHVIGVVDNTDRNHVHVYVFILKN